MKKGKSGKQSIADPFSRRYKVLLLLTASNKAYHISKLLGVSPMVISKDIKWLLGKKWIIDIHPETNKYKSYRLTDLGKHYLGAFEKAERKELYKIENLRHKSKIQNVMFLQNFLKHKSYNFKRNKKFRNSKYYYGYIEGWSTQVIIGKKDSTIIITPPPVWDDGMAKASTRVRENVLNIYNRLNKKWHLNLSLPEPTRHAQFTIPDDFAKAMNSLSGGSQLKFETEEGTVTIDQSKGKEPRLEFPSERKAKDYLKVPDLILQLVNKIDHQTKVTTAGYQVLAQAIEKNTSESSKFRQVITKVFELNDVKLDDKGPEKSDHNKKFDKSGMYG